MFAITGVIVITLSFILLILTGYRTTTANKVAVGGLIIGFLLMALEIVIVPIA